MKFCSLCGQTLTVRIPDGDHLARHVCLACGEVHYINPKIIVGCVPEAADGRILMCRRAIEPRLGYWTFPAGFMELGETCAAGAARETLEEAQAHVDVGSLLAVVDIPYVNQVHMIYRGRLRSSHHGITAESSETRLMSEAEIPWQDIAFPSILHSLRCFLDDRSKTLERVHSLCLGRHSVLESLAAQYQSCMTDPV